MGTAKESNGADHGAKNSAIVAPKLICIILQKNKMEACGGKKKCNRQLNLLPRGNPCIQMKFSVPRALKSRQLFCGASRQGKR